MVNEDFRFGSSDGTNLHLDQVKHNRFSAAAEAGPIERPFLPPHGDRSAAAKAIFHTALAALLP